MYNILVNKDFVFDYMESNDISSVNKLAREIGISESCLHRVLNGERRPGHKVISKMLGYFNVEFEKVFFYRNEFDKSQ